MRRAQQGETGLAGRLALVRAAHLNAYIAALRDIGAPVERDLARSQLPTRIEETPDSYVSIPLALEWIARTGHDLEPMEIGLLGAQKASVTSLRPAHRTVIAAAQTGLRRLEALAAQARFEDSALDIRIRHEAGQTRVLCDMAGFARHPFMCLAEWLNLQAVVSIVRSVAGAQWCPPELCFTATNRLPQAVCAAFPDARILMGQAHTSVLVSSADLARPAHAASAPARATVASTTAGGGRPAPDSWPFPVLLRELIAPYLMDGRPDVAFAAEVAGISTRTLQRRLMQNGSSYSQVLQEARFATACTRLADPAMKVIDVAMMTGYDSPQHFTRAFRRYTGLTPTQYRQQGIAGAV